MIKRLVKHNKYSLISLAAVCILTALWEIVAVLLNKSFLLPRFSETVVEFFLLWGKKEFYVATGGTLWRCVAGFAVSFALGLGLGILGGRYRWLRSAFAPIIAFLRTTPTMALTLVLMVWLRSTLTPIFIGFIMVFPIIYKTVCDSVASVDFKLLEMARVYDFGASKTVKYVYIPSVAPMLFSSAATAFGLNIKAVISAEILAYTASSVGIKMYVAKADIFGGTATLFAWVIVAILLSAVFELLLNLLQRRLCKKWS